jgi:hypothetical protein
MQTKHPRGAPAGNKNALKHGYYSRELTKKERGQLRRAADLSDVAQEIALLRFEIMKATSTGDVAKLVPLSKAAQALEKLIRTQHKIFNSQDKLTNAMRNVIMYSIVPMLTSQDALSFLNNHYPHITSEPAVLDAIKNQIDPGIEADFTENKKQSTGSV